MRYDFLDVKFFRLLILEWCKHIGIWENLVQKNKVELKIQLIQQGTYTDCVDELIFKVVNVPIKRMKIEYV